MKQHGLLLATALSLTACTGLPLPMMFTSISPDTPGISTAISGKTGLRVIDTISFASPTEFAQEPISACVNGHILPPQAVAPGDDTRLIRFAGSDRIMASGSSQLTYRQYGIIPATDTLSFSLSVAARPGGVSYRFRNIIRTHTGTERQISLYDRDNRQVYDSLQALFHQLDTCVAGQHGSNKTA